MTTKETTTTPALPTILVLTQTDDGVCVPVACSPDRAVLVRKAEALWPGEEFSWYDAADNEIAVGDTSRNRAIGQPETAARLWYRIDAVPVL